MFSEKIISPKVDTLFILIFTQYVYWFAREEGIERNIDRLPPASSPTEGQTHNLDMCPEWDRTPSLWVDEAVLQSAEPPSQGYKQYS